MNGVFCESGLESTTPDAAKSFYVPHPDFTAGNKLYLQRGLHAQLRA
jgi:hypothetical protein